MSLGSNDRRRRDAGVPWWAIDRRGMSLEERRLTYHLWHLTRSSLFFLVSFSSSVAAFSWLSHHIPTR